MKITTLQKKTIKEIAEKYDLKIMLLFGSLARDQAREDSDADIGVLVCNDFGLRQQLSLMSDLRPVFRRDVDLSILNHANPLHLYQATKDAVLLFGSEKEYCKFRLYAFHRYNDYAPYFKLEAEMNKKLIKKYASGY